jgi:hypothetical protein
MTRRRREALDWVIEDWARQRRRIVGVEDPATAREYLGAVRCTLGNRRGLHGKGNGHATQPYPEIYTGRSVQAVNAAYWAATPKRKLILDVHYVIPGQPGEKARIVGLSVTTYFRLVESARAFIEGRLSVQPA